MNGADPREEAVCPGCMEDPEGADFCPRCGAPVGRFTTLDPIKSIDAQGLLFRRSARARIGPIVLVGMWLLLGLPAAVMVLAAVVRPRTVGWIPLLTSAGICVLYLLVLIRVTRNFAVNRPGPGPRDPGKD
ncbi:MAG TPA: hypothetical protein VJV23_12675 [Candidatus Polarisedimenticolia bacterium]|nr:hypothetical protein [Candidatus Polarisedimenticolia bacterium]